MTSRVARTVAFLTAATIIVSWLVAVASAEVVGWHKVTPIRRVSETGILGELLSRMPADYAARYRDSDPGTTGHYFAHAINAQTRNQAGGTGRVNAFYCQMQGQGGMVMILSEPRNIRLSEVVPRGSSRVALSYDWENQPLYLCDELSANIVGTIARLQNRSPSSTAGSLGFAHEVFGYCVRLQALCRQRGYPHQAELDSYLAWCSTTLDTLDKVVSGEIRRPVPQRIPIVQQQPRYTPRRRSPIQRAPSYGGFSGGYSGGGGDT